MPCQYVDITDANLPDGDYTLRVTQDPENVIAEANESNNVATATVHLGPPTTPASDHVPGLCGDGPAAGDSSTSVRRHPIVHDPRGGVVERVRVVDLHGSHTYMQDLAFVADESERHLRRR